MKQATRWMVVAALGVPGCDTDASEDAQSRAAAFTTDAEQCGPIANVLRARHGVSLEALDALSSDPVSALMACVDAPSSSSYQRRQALKALGHYEDRRIVSFAEARIDTASLQWVPLYMLSVRGASRLDPDGAQRIASAYQDSVSPVVRASSERLAQQMRHR